MTTSQLLVRLKKLARDAGNNYYQRVALADEILDDKEWIRSSFRGDVYEAAQSIERDYFHDLSGSMTIWQLLHIYRKYPSESDWKKQNYNLQKLYALLTVDRPKIERRHISLAQYQALEQRLQESDFRVKQLQKELREKVQEVSRLLKVEQEAAKMRGQIEELERIVRNKLAG